MIKLIPKNNRNFQEDTSRKRGEQILENKGISSTAPANSSDGSRIKNNTGKVKAKGMSDWMKQNALLNDDEK